MDKPGSWFFTSKMFEKHLWKIDILSKDAGQRPTTWFLHKWNIGRKWVNKELFLTVMSLR